MDSELNAQITIIIGGPNCDTVVQKIIAGRF
jgi:hypothetical protein